VTVFPDIPVDDPWAWLHEEPEDRVVPIADIDVVAALYPLGTRADQDRLVRAVSSGQARPRALVGADDVPDDAEWVWVLTDQCEPDHLALVKLLEAVARDRYADVIGCLTVEHRRRGTGVLIRDYGQTMSHTGRLRTLAEPGELYQGQLRARRILGAPVAGMLVRGQVWRALGGVTRELPPSLWGLDLGWRANLMGAQVMIEPDAHVVDRVPSDPADERAGGLTLVAAHSPFRLGLPQLRLLVMTLLAALGFVLGKDLGRAGEEVRGLWRWLSNRSMRHAARVSLVSFRPTMVARTSTKELLPGSLAGVRRAVDAGAARLADWVATFSQRSEKAASFDELTGDDFADQRQTSRRVPAVVVGLVAAVVLAVVAGRRLYGAGSLQGPAMLPAANWWSDMMAAYLTPVPGTAGLATPPWEALTGLVSLVAIGRPEWLVSVLVVACVPLAWLLAFRLLRKFTSSAWLAGAAAGGYALVPALSGALNLSGYSAAVWAILLPVAGYAVWWWQAGPGQGTWRGAAGVGLWLLVATAWFPLSWPLALVAGVVVVALRRAGVALAQWLLVAVVPVLLLIGPWARTLVAFPGRILTGADPSLAPTTLVSSWQIPFLALSSGPVRGPSGDVWHRLYDGFTNGLCPPLWLSVSVVGVLWVVAVIGAFRRPRAAWFLGGAAVCGAGAVVVTRLLVWAPPGAWVRPSGTELAMLMAGCLVLAALVGLDGVSDDLRDRSLGLWHLGVLGTVVVSIAALALGTAWWALGGETSLSRQPASALPSFVQNMQTSPTPGRTLAISMTPTAVTWSLFEGTQPRLGQAEGGFALAGDQDALSLANSVVARLVAGSADNQLDADLQSLGVANIWLDGGDASVRTGISNTPGLQAGTGQGAWMVWPVSGSAIAAVTSGTTRTPAGDGQAVPAGDAGRVLVLSQPDDPRWQVSVNGTPLVGQASSSGMQFAVGSQGGVLSLGLDAGTLWWAWAQAAGLLVIVVLALPGVRPRATGPKRVAGGGA